MATTIAQREKKISKTIERMRKIQDKVLGRKKLTLIEKKLDDLQNHFGFYYGAKEAIKQKIVK